jgi:Protein of unknown function (DUF3014)
MTHDDLPLHQGDSPESAAPAARPSSPTRWVIIGAAAVITGALLTLWWMSRAQPAAAVPAPATATEVALASKRPKRQNLDTPPLGESDTFLADLVATLSKHPTLARLFATKGIVRSLTLAVVQIGDGKTPAAPLAVLRPLSRLRIIGASPSKIEPVTYIRWDSDVAALLSVSPEDTARTYVNVKQLFDEAYHELGHPDADFDEAIVRAIRVLDATPDLAGDPVLVERPRYFEHEDPALRSLLPVQKQLLLVGPAHRRRLITWLKDLAANLDLKID